KMLSNEFQRIVDHRRSNRSFDPSVDVPDEVMIKSLDRAILSPNSSNMQLWEFHWIRSEKELERFVPLCLDQRAAKTAKHMVVFVTRADKWRERAKWNLNKIKSTIVGEPTKLQKSGIDYYGKLMPLMYANDPFGLMTLIRRTISFVMGIRKPFYQAGGRAQQRIVVHKSCALAAQTRDQIQSLQRIFTRQTVMSPDGEDRDVFNLYREAGTAGVQVLFIRNGRLLGSDFFFFDTSEQASDANLLGQAINRLYTSEMTGIPRQVLLPFEYPEEEILGDALSEQAGHRVQLMVPKRGHKKELVSLAFQNARANLEEQRRRVVKDSEILRQVQNFLHLKKLPDRVECFDISHFSGEMTVASMVCWEGNKPAKENYRKYKLRTIHSPDDFASMEEVLTRRYQRALSGQQPLPDLIIIDGGKGQLNAALAVLEKLGIDWHQQDIIGLAKGRSERRRGVTRGNDEDYEYVVKPNQKNEIRLQRHSSVLYFLQNIRDEAHRFAIEFQRKLKRQDNLKSLLDEIPGVGNRRKRALLKHFGSLKRVREASVEELQQVSGISPILAEEIVRFFKECDSFLKKKYAASQKES
ncbi:MAG: excinuclease ABC subunit UvrC, partial [bacterium]